MFSLDESFQTTCSQLVTTLLGVSDLLRSCPDNSDTVPLSQGCHKVYNTRLSLYCYIMTVSVLLEQPCHKSDSLIKLVTSCEQLVPTISNKQFENNLVSSL